MTNGAQLGGWYVRRGSRTYGPYSWDEIVEHARARRISSRDMLYDPSAGGWARATSVASLFGKGGAATGTAVGMSVAKSAATIVLLLATLLGVVLGAFFSFNAYAGSFSFGEYASDSLNKAALAASEGPRTTRQTALPPEGVCYKGTFRSVWLESQNSRTTKEDVCYLWVTSTDDGTTADFRFGDGFVDGWPGYIQSGPTGNIWGKYVFSNPASLVEVVRIEVFLGEKDMTSGYVVNTTQNIGSFVSGTFSGKRIPYEEYKAAVLD